MKNKISPEELKYKIDKKEDIFLLDVRTEEEYNTAKIKNSHLMPINEIELRYNELPKNKEIIVYCHHGIRSAKAVEFLKSKNFINIKSLTGGIDAYSELDHSIEKY